jgi:transposase
MVKKGQPTSLAERVEIGERWQAGESDTQIAIAMDRPIATIRKWRRRFQHQGRAGLSNRMGRPAMGALSQYPEEISKDILCKRKAHPGWGPLTILVELKKDIRFAEQRLPSRSRIAVYLKQRGQVRK